MNEEIAADMTFTKKSVHAWGTRNRVEFDADKEHVLIMHLRHGEGELVKLLGCTIDAKLTMSPAVDQLVARVRPKVKALLRTRGMYSHADMMMQYKTHIWGLIEYHNGAIFHACETVLAKLDRVQTSFLEQIHSNDETGFLYYNFAPPVLRRDIGILGFLHKLVLGIGHPALAQFLQFSPLGSH